ncbi:trypsin-like serine peptidase [Actinokineospora iranica]
MLAVVSPVGAAPAAVAMNEAKTAKVWSAEDMRAAVPVENLIGDKLGKISKAAERKLGTPTTVQPTAVDPLAFPDKGSEWTGGGAVTKTAGRIFFTLGDRKAACSGNAVTSANRSVVITAGHCVKHQGNWHTNWVFVPGYRDGAAPFGQWPAKKTLTVPQWENSSDMNFDIGAAVVDQVDGKSLTDVVGGQGIAFNQPKNQDMYAFGYPAVPSPPYNGEKLIYCSGKTSTDFFITRDHKITCGMKNGASGGPWFLKFDESTGLGVQASVNSFGYVFLPNALFGPYFGKEAQTLYDTAQAA